MSNQVYPALDHSNHRTADASKTELESNLMQDQSQIQLIDRKYRAYNYFIENYNNEINQINHKLMITVPESITTGQFSCWGFIYLIIFAYLPCSNLLVFLYMVYKFINLILICNRIRINKNKVPDPFKRMVYCPGLCQANAYLKLSQNILLEDLLKLGITTKEYNEAIRRQELEGNFEIIMFYNDRFSESYLNAGEGLNRKILITIVLILVSSGSLSFWIWVFAP